MHTVKYIPRIIAVFDFFFLFVLGIETRGALALSYILGPFYFLLWDRSPQVSEADLELEISWLRLLSTCDYRPAPLHRQHLIFLNRIDFIFILPCPHPDNGDWTGALPLHDHYHSAVSPGLRIDFVKWKKLPYKLELQGLEKWLNR